VYKNKRIWNITFYDNPTSRIKKVSISNTRPRIYEINRKRKEYVVLDITRIKRTRTNTLILSNTRPRNY